MARYKNRHNQLLFDTLLRLADDPTSELYHQKGSVKGEPRRGANVRNYFWLGTGRIINPMPVPQTQGWIAYQAGKALARICKARGTK